MEVLDGVPATCWVVLLPDAAGIAMSQVCSTRDQAESLKQSYAAYRQIDAQVRRVSITATLLPD